MSLLPPRHLRRDRRGNVAMMYALALPVLMFAIGLAIDFTHAAQVRTELNAAADAAVLAALTPSMMQQSNATAQTAATNMFNGQIAGLTSLAAGDTTVTVTVANPSGNTLVRNVTVAYSAQNTNIFASVLGAPTFALSGSSSASASAAANIDFYLLLDNSPSMALPASPGGSGNPPGIIEMQNLTPYENYQNGAFQQCAFACHQAVAGSSDPSDTAGNPCAKTVGSTTTYSAPTVYGSYQDPSGGGGMSPSKPIYCSASQGTQIDNYQVARNNNITLRIDQLTAAICGATSGACSSNSLLYAAQQSTANSVTLPAPKYRFAAYSIDTLWSIPGTTPGVAANNNVLMGLSTSTNYVSAWQAAAPNFGVMEMYVNNQFCANSACTSGGTTSNQGDVATNYDTALSSINTTMPNPGMGSNVNGDTPQEVLFIVTDGVEDELYGGLRLQQQINASSSATPNYCTTIKNRGIRIAILYTAYLPIPSDWWYQGYVAPFQPYISSALQACASPGLFYQAAIGADLGAALQTLFNTAVQTAHLTN